jgi:choice-of-anchor B domain-containing protein
MKKIYSTFIVILILLSPIILKAQYSSSNITLLGHWYNPAQPAEPTYGIKYNSVWGWVDAAHGNTEYAILGSGLGTHFIDISVPSNPVEKDFVLGFRTSCIWREYKSYGNYLYVTSDDPVPNSFQIIDMSYLPDSVHVVYDGNTIFERAHTLYIDGDKLYIGSVKEHMPGGSNYSMAVYSLANPELPTLLRALNSDDPSITWVHDMFVRNDTVYASCGYQGLFMYKYNVGANNFTTINTLTSYVDQGYNHSSALTPDGKTLVFCDEVPAGKVVKILDVTDITNVNMADTINSHFGATAHNPYVLGNDRAIIASYQDGVQIYDISNPTNVSITGFFDTDTLHGVNDGFTTQAYHGAWGAYVDLPSGLILSSDMQNGLYIFDATAALGVHENVSTSNSVIVYPNPSNADFSVALKLIHSDELLFELYDISGKKVVDKTEAISSGYSVKAISTSNLARGIYLLKISGKEISYTQKIVKN